MVQTIQANISKGYINDYDFSPIYFAMNSAKYLYRYKMDKADREDYDNNNLMELEFHCDFSKKWECSFNEIKGFHYTTYNYVLRYVSRHKFRRNFDASFVDIITMY